MSVDFRSRISEPASQNLSMGPVLVTGAGSGIGRATAYLLAKSGVTAIALIDSDAGALNETAAGLEGCDLLIREVDVTNDVELRRAFQDASDRWGGLAHVFNNAGMMSPFPAFPDAQASDVSRTIDVNFRAVVLGTQYGYAAIRKRGRGSVVNTSSGAAIHPLATDPVYAGTKAAINQFSLSCVEPFRVSNVRINVLCPGVVDTPILASNTHPELRPATTHELMDQAGLIMLTADQIASEAVRLMRDEALTGQIVSIRNMKRGN